MKQFYMNIILPSKLSIEENRKHQTVIDIKSLKILVSALNEY